MSLQIWLPLVGDTVNRGLASSEITSNTLTYGTGPLGSSATFSSNYILINGTPIKTGVNEFSFAFWYKPSDTTTSHCIYNGRTSVGAAVALFRLNSNTFRFDDGSQHTFTYKPTTDWTHYVFTRDSSSVKLYVNGVLNQTVTSTSFTCTATYASIGMSSVNTASPADNKLVGGLCDYRIYNHCLSVKEVKELAKGLSIHLPLKGLPANPNLFVNTGDKVFKAWNTNGSVSSVTRVTDTILGTTALKVTVNNTSSSASGNNGIWVSTSNSGVRLNPNSTYTTSFYAKSDIETTFATNIAEGRSITQSDLKVTTSWKRCYATFKSTSTGVTTCFYVSVPANTTYSFYIAAPKCEEGSQATPWIPNIYDSDYSRLGYGTLSLPYTLTGGSTNNTGNISSFSSSKYITTGYTLNPGSSTWEVTTRLTTGTDITTQQYVEGCMGIEGAYGILFGINTSSQTVLWISSAGKGWDIANGVAGSAVTASTTYWFKYGWDGTNYYLKRSTDGGTTWTTEITVASTTAITGMAFYLGSCWDKTKPFLGSIDMDKFSITVNKNPVYVGAPIQGNKNIIQEVSGYGRTVTLAGRVTPVSETPAGMGANFISGGKLSVNSGFPVGSQPPFTIAMWHKPTDNTYAIYEDIFGTDVGTSSSTSYGGFFRLENVDATGTSYKWFGNGYIASSAGLCANTAEIGTWRHIALTFDGATFTQYIDGVQTATHTLESTYAGFKTYGKFYVGDIFMDAADCRVYGTCLSADDVKALYSTPISIDKTGKLYCREIVEE